LEGAVNWGFQREAAERAVRNLTGVTGVNNLVKVEPQARVTPAHLRDEIFAAFHRNADLEARRIGVESREGRVILHGNVNSWTEGETALQAAWRVPGVSEVMNHLAITP
jgi:osmotically-inducible protein OsmY